MRLFLALECERLFMIVDLADLQRVRGMRWCQLLLHLYYYIYIINGYYHASSSILISFRVQLDHRHLQHVLDGEFFPTVGPTPHPQHIN